MALVSDGIHVSENTGWTERSTIPSFQAFTDIGIYGWTVNLLVDFGIEKARSNRRNNDSFFD